MVLGLVRGDNVGPVAVVGGGDKPKEISFNGTEASEQNTHSNNKNIKGQGSCTGQSVTPTLRFC